MAVEALISLGKLMGWGDRGCLIFEKCKTGTGCLYQIFKCIFNTATVWWIDVEALPGVICAVVPSADPVTADT